MDAYTRAADGGAARRPPQLHRARVHELGWDRPARDAARAGEPGEAAAARVRAQRPLPPDLRADPARRGDRRSSTTRPRRSRPRPEEESDERAETPHATQATGRSRSTGSTVGERPRRRARHSSAASRSSRPIQGFGKMWQKTYRVSLAGVDVDAAGGDRDVEGGVPDVLAEGQPVPRAADRDRAGRGGAAPGVGRRRDEALDRRLRPLRRRGVVHVHDAAGPHVRRLDHVLGAPRRTARRSRSARC